MITALCGGVGGVKLVWGLYRNLPPGSLSVIVNTGDDLAFCGLRVCPDLDTVTYTLGGISGRQGWGVAGDTFHALETLGALGVDTWFQIGDRDLATHVYRSYLLDQGRTLTEVTATLARAMGIAATILPMTDDPVATRLLAGGSWVDFQEYFVRRGHRDTVTDVLYEGIDRARAGEEVIDAIMGAQAVIVVNSNPVLSILPVVSVPGVRQALRDTDAVRIAVSPIVGTSAVTGPAGHLMALRGQPSTAAGVAALYDDFIDAMVVHDSDRAQEEQIRDRGKRVLRTNILMPDDRDRERLACETLRFVEVGT